MRIRPLLQTALALVALGLAGCSSDDEKVAGMTGFDGRLLDFRLAPDGNLAIPGDFEFVDRSARWKQKGWLVSTSQEAAAAQLKASQVVPGKGFYLDDSPGAERRRERPAPATVVLSGNKADWRATLDDRQPDFADTLLAPPEIFRNLAKDDSGGPRVKITYDALLLMRQERALRTERQIGETVAVAAMIALFGVINGGEIATHAPAPEPKPAPAPVKKTLDAAEVEKSVKKARESAAGR